MNILPQFINLDDTAPQRPHFVLPLIVDYSARDDTPIDPVQCTAVYRYKTSIGKELHQFELQGVEITDTRLSRAQTELEALRARLTAAEAALSAAGQYVNMLREYITPREMLKGIDESRDGRAYTAALARLQEMTE